MPGHPFVQIPTIGAVAKIVTAAKSLSLIGMFPVADEVRQIKFSNAA